MKTRQTLLYSGLLIGVTLLYTLIVYPRLPDRMPIHWNIRGEVDGWGDKRWAAFLGIGMMALILGLMHLLPLLSRRPFRVESFRETYNFITFILVSLFGYIQMMALRGGLHPDSDISRPLIAGLLLFFAVIGNVMGKVRRNEWVGVRTPWTLKSDFVWIATHRLAGRLMVATSLGGAIGIWAGLPIMLCFVPFLVGMFYPVLYSYLLYRKRRENGWEE